MSLLDLKRMVFRLLIFDPLFSFGSVYGFRFTIDDYSVNETERRNTLG